MNIITLEDIKWKKVTHISMGGLHICQFRNEEYGLQWEQHTKVKWPCGFAKPKNYYYIDGKEKEYTVLQTLCDDWNEIKNFDDPNAEIVWVKVIKNKK